MIHEASDDNLFKCHECQKGFKTKIGMETHYKNSHSGTQTKFICEVCGKVFTNRANLTRHCDVNGHKCSGKSHKMNRKSTQCKLCNKIVVDIDEHNSVYHPNVSTKDTNVKIVIFNVTGLITYTDIGGYFMMSTIEIFRQLTKLSRTQKM